jgi:hypothetical protein
MSDARRLWAFFGKGKCDGATAYVLGETKAAARARLLRIDSCIYFDIASAAPLEVWMPPFEKGQRT